MALLPGTDRLGPYRLLEKLGSGAMGAVYLAEGEHGRVALKVLHPHLVERKGLLARFEREGRACQMVDHPNVVRALDADLQLVGGVPHCLLVMEYVEGKTLRAFLQEHGPLPEALLREVALQIALGLEAIHAQGIVHRDVKPDNVLITRDNRVRIMDLGVAHLEDTTQGLTQTGQFLGSLPYAAPEQLMGSGVGPPTDLYALGVVLYELITGSNPFRHPEARATVVAHLERVPPRVQELEPEASLFISEVISTLLEKDPGMRFASARELRFILERGERAPWWKRRERAILTRKGHFPRIPVRPEAALTGRNAELDLLRGLWADTLVGQGRALLLEGETGIGKTRLVDAFLRELAGADVHALYGSYPPAGGRGGISDAILEYFGGASLEEELRGCLPDNPSLAPALAALLRQAAPPEGADAIDGDVLHAVLAQLLRSLAARRPLVWIVEDLHLADRDCWSLAATLVKASRGQQALVLLTTGPGLPAAETARFEQIAGLVRHQLERLGAKDVTRLLADRLQNDDLVARLATRIAVESDGIPLFVCEILRSLELGHFIEKRADGSYVDAEAIGELEVPVAVQDLVEGQLGDLGKDERAVLDVGAVVGFAFETALVARALGRPHVAVLQDLAAMERRAGIVRADGAGYRFDHHLLREAVYRALHPKLRREYHTAVAAAMEQAVESERAAVAEPSGFRVVEMCRHFLEGGQQEKVRRYLDPALDRLQEAHQHEAWITLAHRALAEDGLLGGLSRARLLLEVSRELEYLGRPAEDRGIEEEAVALAETFGDPALQSRAHGSLGSRLVKAQQVEEGVRELALALELAREAGEAKLEARIHTNLGATYRRLGRLKEARGSNEQAIAALRRVGDVTGEAAATLSLGSVLRDQGRHVDARTCFEEGRGLARRCGDRRREAQAAWMLAGLSASLGDGEAACRHATLSLELVREIHYRPGEARATAFLGRALVDLGRLAEARPHLERGLDAARELGDQRIESWVCRSLTTLEATVGRYRDARPHLERVLALALELGHPAREATARARLGGLLGETCASPEARKMVEEGVALARRVRDRSRLCRALLHWGRLLQRADEPAAAIAPLEEARDLARELASDVLALEATALLAPLKPEALEDALRALARAGTRAPLAKRLEARFHLWQATGDEDHLREAHHLLGQLHRCAPEADRTSLLENVRLHRDILRAGQAHGLGDLV